MEGIQGRNKGGQTSGVAVAAEEETATTQKEGIGVKVLCYLITVYSKTEWVST